MYAWGVAGCHAPPVLEPTVAACRGVARPVPFRGAGRGMRTPGPSGGDGLHALSRPPSAEGINVIGPVRAQTGPRLIGSGFYRVGPKGCRGASARHAQGTGGDLIDPSWMRKPPRLRPRAGSASFRGASARAGPLHGGPFRIGPPTGHPARPAAPVAPVGRAAIAFRFPYAADN